MKKSIYYSCLYPSDSKELSISIYRFLTLTNSIPTLFVSSVDSFWDGSALYKAFNFKTKKKAKEQLKVVSSVIAFNKLSYEAKKNIIIAWPSPIPSCTSVELDEIYSEDRTILVLLQPDDPSPEKCLADYECIEL